VAPSAIQSVLSLTNEDGVTLRDIVDILDQKGPIMGLYPGV